MKNYALSCCSTVDLTAEKLAERQISWASFHYYLDGVEYLDDMFSSSMDASTFYNKISLGAKTKTSQINIEEYLTYFEKLFLSYDEIVHLTQSSGLSGTYNNAKTAINILKEKHPEKKVYLIDSLCASSGLGLLMDMLADKRDEGMTASKLCRYAEEIKRSIHINLYSTNISFFIKGGRLSKAAGLVGNALKICPNLYLNGDGKLVAGKKTCGKIKALKELVSSMASTAIDGKDYNGKCFISHSNCLDEAIKLKSFIEQEFKNLLGKIEIFSIGPTIGCHSGPGTVAIFFVGKPR